MTATPDMARRTAVRPHPIRGAVCGMAAGAGLAVYLLMSATLVAGEWLPLAACVAAGGVVGVLIGRVRPLKRLRAGRSAPLPEAGPVATSSEPAPPDRVRDAETDAALRMIAEAQAHARVQNDDAMHAALDETLLAAPAPAPTPAPATATAVAAVAPPMVPAAAPQIEPVAVPPAIHPTIPSASIVAGLQVAVLGTAPPARPPAPAPEIAAPATVHSVVAAPAPAAVMPAPIPAATERAVAPSMTETIVPAPTQARGVAPIEAAPQLEAAPIEAAPQIEIAPELEAVPVVASAPAPAITTAPAAVPAAQPPLEMLPDLTPAAPASLAEHLSEAALLDAQLEAALQAATAAIAINQ